MCFSSNKNYLLKVKLWWVGARERKKRTLSGHLILSEGNFWNICVLSQYIVHWIHFQNIKILHIKSPYFIRFCCLFLKSSNAFSVSLINGGTHVRTIIQIKIFQTFVVFLFQITINSYLISTIMENVCRLFHILGKFLFTADERKLWLFICITRWLYELPHELPNN